MINTNDLDAIVEQTLKNIGSKDVSTRMLIKLTFLLESGLEDLTDNTKEKNYVGFCQMSRKTMCYIIENVLIPRSQLANAINTVSLVDVRRDSFDRQYFNLMTNISFQICMVYAFYRYQWGGPPEDNIEDVINYYFRFYDDKKALPSPKKVEKIKKKYYSIFEH